MNRNSEQVRRMVLLGWVLASLGLLAGCNSKAKEGERCDKPEDCREGLTCHDSMCMRPEATKAAASASAEAKQPAKDQKPEAVPPPDESAKKALAAILLPAPGAARLSATKARGGAAREEFSKLDMNLRPTGGRGITNDCFMLTVPREFFTERETQERLLVDGVPAAVAFSDRNGALLAVTCVGPSAMSLADYYELELRTTSEEQQARITRKVQEKGWFVISGEILGGQGIIYKRVTKVGPAYIEVQMTWPTSHREQYDSRADDLAKGVKPGPGILGLAGGK